VNQADDAWVIHSPLIKRNARGQNFTNDLIASCLATRNTERETAYAIVTTQEDVTAFTDRTFVVSEIYEANGGATRVWALESRAGRGTSRSLLS